MRKIYKKHASKNKRKMEEYIVPLFHWKGVEFSLYMGWIFQLIKFWFKLFYFINHGSHISNLIHIIPHLMTSTVNIYNHKNKSHCSKIRSKCNLGWKLQILTQKRPKSTFSETFFSNEAVPKRLVYVVNFFFSKNVAF